MEGLRVDTRRAGDVSRDEVVGGALSAMFAAEEMGESKCDFASLHFGESET